MLTCMCQGLCYSLCFTCSGKRVSIPFFLLLWFFLLSRSLCAGVCGYLCAVCVCTCMCTNSHAQCPEANVECLLQSLSLLFCYFFQSLTELGASLPVQPPCCLASQRDLLVSASSTEVAVMYSQCWNVLSSEHCTLALIACPGSAFPTQPSSQPSDFNLSALSSFPTISSLLHPA